ncbi:unnamed protein product, partial [Symbiodinium necroappetens]
IGAELKMLDCELEALANPSRWQECLPPRTSEATSLDSVIGPSTWKRLPNAVLLQLILLKLHCPMLGSMVTPVQGDLGQTAATPPHDASDSEEEDDSFVLQRTSTVKDGRSAPASGEAADDSALRANPGFRVKNTFIHVDEEVGTGMGRTESDQFAATRTQSDPSGSNVRLPRWPSRQAPRVPAVPEDSSEAPAESDSDESGEQRTHKELERFETWDHFAAQAHGYAGSLPMPGADVPPMMPMIPVGMPQEGYQMPAAFGWPGASDQMTLAPSTGPAFGLVHSFHKEVRGFGLASPDLRQFTKGQDYEGRLSVISGSEVQRGGVQKYLMQFSDGELTKADGVGFVFASRVPCAKNIQKIVSVFVNQRGRICMRVFGDILKAKKHVRALQVGDWIEMAIDLENSIATFKVWSYETVASGYMPMEPDSTAEFHYGKRLAQANQLSAKPATPPQWHTKAPSTEVMSPGIEVKLNVGHFACVIQNVGVTDFKEPAQPLNGLEAPRSRRAVDVVKYLWEEAQWDQVDPVGRIMAEFSEDCVYEDLSREQEAFVGFEEVKRYQQETKDSTPDNLRFFLDEVTDGDKACTVLWHVEFNSRMSPRGVSYYELNEEGK